MVMRKIFITIGCMVLSVFLFAQKSDTIARKNFPKHYIGINPLNVSLFQQAGITYEYKPGRFSFGLSAGYIYPNKLNFSRLFMIGTNRNGAYEYYSGCFFLPQINFYLNKPRDFNNGTFYYLSLKGVYKFLTCDSNKYYVWDHEHDWYNPDIKFVYRKQIDKVHASGAFLVFGIKEIEKHFFIDINLGLGFIGRNSRSQVFGRGTNVDDWVINNTGQGLNYTEKYSQMKIAVHFSAVIGGNF